MHVGQAHADRRELLVIQPGRDFHGLIAHRPGNPLLDIGENVGREREDFAELRHRGLRIGHPLGHHIDAEIGAVGGERRAVAVENPAAAGRDQRQIDPVAFGFELVLLVLRDRQPGEATGQQRADPAHRRSDGEAAARERAVERRRADEGAAPGAAGAAQPHAVTR